MGQGQHLGLSPAAYAPENLYRIETNQGFTWEPAPLEGELAAAASSLGLSGATTVQRVRKRNLASSIYRLHGSERVIILRCCPASLEASTEAQCRILAAVRYPHIVKPLGVAGDRYTLRTGALVWMAYRELPGELFPGQGGSAPAAVAEVLALQAALTALEADAALESQLARLPRAAHRPERWSPFMVRLAGGDLSFPPDTLSAATEALLRQNQGFLLATAERVAALPIARDRGLTHNDLHHANVLVNEGGYWFLDVEDICWESRRVALVHSGFKLCRHLVFSGAASRAEARGTIMPEIVERIGGGVDDLFAHGAFRIVSDIFEIAALSLEQRDDSALYDLEKRIHNLFELHDLMGGT